ncbi:hypothetical protein CSKR_104500 [Clonorchis sinensis]|uniref:Uncharacterized protein n=1 Tax=Clonorchis sinensis TaxID=79923 RepID=A0A3R7CK24_CLOSI|nr:hypothetical protein CSKR_104500 [Clonorchis sinensis]
MVVRQWRISVNTDVAVYDDDDATSGAPYQPSCQASDKKVHGARGNSVVKAPADGPEGLWLEANLGISTAPF